VIPAVSNDCSAFSCKREVVPEEIYRILLDYPQNFSALINSNINGVKLSSE
jgi:hypothetical protein